MDSLLLQDWTTVNNNNSGVVTQGAPSYLDVSEYHDLAFYLHLPSGITTGGGTGLPLLQYQTAPVAEESAFQVMFQTPGTFTGGTRVDVIRGSYSPVPPSKYVRWVCIGTGYNGCTFRIWVVGYRLP
jgi:hypothetical protein